ncbi:M20/M25/M40 family metallo-hydrolase [Actinomycetospora sp. CA-101289]|uniref:M20/M25/M40 family metallo-hydrolase n=1 Tax=Actinomycetospora sp. CA-101289 TaxID=3239893 RepID=UPI003D958D14
MTTHHARPEVRVDYPRMVRDLARFASIPSVSADAARAGDVRRAAAWLAQHARASGFAEVRVHRTPGHPAVVAWTRPTGRPLVLVYGHYDVQPAGLAASWTSPPFRPTRRGAHLVGRGVSDDKGPLIAHLAAVRAWAAAGRRSVDVVLVADGEEEVGSPHLGPVLDAVVRRRRPDAVVVSDTRMWGPRRPALTVSLRGALHLRLDVLGASSDLHSGAYGGAVADPARELVRVLATLHDDEGRLTFATDERTTERRIHGGPDDQELLTAAGARRPATGAVEAGWTAYERSTVRPALVVSRLRAGSAGGRGRAAAIVPRSASAELTIRLPPGHDPDVALGGLTTRLNELYRAGTSWRLRELSRALPVELPQRGPLVDAASDAYLAGFGRRPVLSRSGGSIPAVSRLTELGAPVVLMGFGLPDDRMHAADERVDLDVLRRSATAVVALHAEIARRWTGKSTGVKPGAGTPNRSHDPVGADAR